MLQKYIILEESGFSKVAICPGLSALSTDLESVIGVCGNGGLYKISFVHEILDSLPAFPLRAMGIDDNISVLHLVSLSLG